MTTSKAFSSFLDKIKVANDEQISLRYHQITKKLNSKFRDTDSEIDNCLQVGSYGRYTGIKGISDLDMLYIMPDTLWSQYCSDPDKLLRHVRDAIKERYPTTEIIYDRLVVDVFFTNFTFEVQPVFEVKDGEEINYKYPDTKYDCYRITKPRQEQKAMTDFSQSYGSAHRHLCKMTRAWKNNIGLGMGGLLIDTLTHRFLSDHTDLAQYSFSQYDILCRDFFEFLKNEPKQDHYQALGSGQDVKVKHLFQNKAKVAYATTVSAIEETDAEKKHEKWRDVFGISFPKAEDTINESSQSISYINNEEFIENLYSVDIRYSLTIDCEISRDGFRETMLRRLLSENKRISRVRSLLFQIVSTDTPEPYVVKWKVRNVGEEAIRRNCIRGQIIDSNKKDNMRKETSNFIGPHYVECYIIKRGVVVARNRLDVPIE